MSGLQELYSDNPVYFKIFFMENLNILESIGNTPMIKIKNFDTGFCELFVKLENQNPGGSIKDRIALTMIEAAERKGKIKPGDEIIEATAGNTGLGLALVATLKGYKLTLVIPDKMSQEKIHHLRAMGVNILITRSDVEKGHPEYYQDIAARIAKERSAYYIDQFNNPANPLAHELTTGPEIWQQMNRDVDAIVLGVGSSGTVTGLTNFFKKAQPNLELVLADPAGSIIAPYINTGKIPEEVGSWLIEGIGEDFIPSIADFSMTHKAYSIPDRDSFTTARDLLIKEGIFAGSSSGTLMASALQYCREQTSKKRVVTFICDSGNKYLTKMYNDLWLKDRGFMDREKCGDLRDLVFRRYGTGEIIVVQPKESLRAAFMKLKEFSISQVPVMENNQVIGVLDESDILIHLTNDVDDFSTPVSTVMNKNVVTIKASASEEELLEILKKDYVALLETDQGEFYGIVTKIDYVNYLRLKTI